MDRRHVRLLLRQRLENGTRAGKIALCMLRRGQKQQGLGMTRNGAQDLLRLSRRARGVRGEKPFGEGECAFESACLFGRRFRQSVVRPNLHPDQRFGAGSVSTIIPAC